MCNFNLQSSIFKIFLLSVGNVDGFLEAWYNTFRYIAGLCSRCGGCGEVVNTADCGSVMRGFEPHHSPHFFLHKLSRFADWTVSHNGGIAKR